MEVRQADPDELPAVMNVLDGALLAMSSEAVETGIGAGRVLVAAQSDRLLGALAMTSRDPDGAHIEAIAVRRSRRGQGLGTALVRAAADRHERLVAEFDENVRPFWASLGFDVAPADELGRYVGTLEPSADDP